MIIHAQTLPRSLFSRYYKFVLTPIVFLATAAYCLNTMQFHTCAWKGTIDAVPQLSAAADGVLLATAAFFAFEYGARLFLAFNSSSGGGGRGGFSAVVSYAVSFLGLCDLASFAAYANWFANGPSRFVFPMNWAKMFRLLKPIHAAYLGYGVFRGKHHVGGGHGERELVGGGNS